MAFTLIGVVAVPADNGAEAGPTATLDFSGSGVTPADNDVVVVFGNYRGNGQSGDPTRPYIRPDGASQLQADQYWNTSRQIFNGTTVSGRVLWTQVKRLSGLSWGSNPTFSIPSGTGPLTLVALVFRPSDSNKFVILDKGPSSAVFTATGTTKTITGYATIEASTVSIGVWMTAVATTWSGLSGSGWSQSGLGTQYRNTTGSDNSITLAYNIRTTQGTLDNVSQTQGTGAAGVSALITFAEIDLPAAGTGTQSYISGANASFDAGGTTIAASLGHGAATGAGIVGAASYEITGAATWVASNGVLDQLGNRYPVVYRVSDPYLEQENILFYRANVPGANTVTVTLSASQIARSVAIHEVANLGSFDRAAGLMHFAVDSFSPEVVSTGNVTPSANGAYMIGYASADSASDNDWFTADANWNVRQIVIYPGDGNNHNTSFDRTQANAAAANLTATMQLGASGPWSMAVFVPGSGATPTTISCNIGSATFAGVRSGVSASVGCGVGAAFFQGVACTVLQPTVVACSVGAAQFSGVGCTVVQPIAVPCAVGAAVFGGVRPGISESIGCAPGHVTFDGVACTVTNAIQVNCSVGSAEFHGVRAGVSDAVACSIGAATFEGVQCQVIQAAVIACSGGAATFSGVRAGVSESIACTLGHAVFQGAAADVVQTVVVACSAGGAVFHGVVCAVDVDNAVAISAVPGAATFDGTAAAISSTTAVPCTAGGAIFQGVPATIAQTVVVACAPGASAWSGVACQVQVGTAINCAAGGAVYAGVPCTITATEATVIGGVPGQAVFAGMRCQITVIEPEVIVPVNWGAGGGPGAAVRPRRRAVRSIQVVDYGREVIHAQVRTTPVVRQVRVRVDQIAQDAEEALQVLAKARWAHVPRATVCAVDEASELVKADMVTTDVDLQRMLALLMEHG